MIGYVCTLRIRDSVKSTEGENSRRLSRPEQAQREVSVMIGYVCTLRIRDSVKSTEGEELAPPKSARASST